MLTFRGVGCWRASCPTIIIPYVCKYVNRLPAHTCASMSAEKTAQNTSFAQLSPEQTFSHAKVPGVETARPPYQPIRAALSRPPGVRGRRAPLSCSGRQRARLARPGPPAHESGSATAARSHLRPPSEQGERIAQNRGFEQSVLRTAQNPRFCVKSRSRRARPTAERTSGGRAAPNRTARRTRTRGI